MIFKEVHSKTILSSSKIFDYVINPYIGCQHACQYCYARFIKKFTGHTEPWGQFVDIKINAAELLQIEARKKKRATVWVSGLCDPYQPLERKYMLTRRCLEILADTGWPVVIQTRSSLVLRDIDIIKRAEGFEVGLSVTTGNDETRKIFEPVAPSIQERLQTLEELHRSGIRTFAMIAPLLPGAETLPEMLAGKVDYIIVDRMNYHYSDWIYKRHNLEDKLTDNYFNSTGREIAAQCKKYGILCNKTF